MTVRKKIKKLFNKTGYSLIKNNTFKRFVENEKVALEYKFLKNFPGDTIEKFLKYKSASYSQLYQDLFVLAETGFKKNGYFVEFGATDGKSLSNTYLLEKNFEWKGILAEPAKNWLPEITKNRSVTIVNKCVWRKSGESLKFMETKQKAVSTIEGFGTDDNFKNSRKENVIYEVESISLFDLLQQNEAPKIIDYLSIDTEGSEFEILKNFPFKEYLFKIITVEHNYTGNRDKIFSLLEENDYVRVFVELSQFDDWYVHKSYLNH